MKLNFEKSFKDAFIETVKAIDHKKINLLIHEIKKIKKKGRIFFLGIGGSAGNCSHAVNDFRKICDIECYTPIDNVSEITARINDEGFKTIFTKYLKVSKLNKNDAIFIFSVGGGNLKKNVSTNLIEAIKYAKTKKTKIFSVTARSDGYSHKNSNLSILITVKNKKFITPISESLQVYIWHLIVSSKELAANKTKW
jgi:D-sedoheptulose 7-phosphate isomerase